MEKRFAVEGGSLWKWFHYGRGFTMEEASNRLRIEQIQNERDFE